MGELDADGGEVEWGYETYPGYFAQDNREQIGDSNLTAEEWLWNFCPGKDRGFVRGHMGLMLFSGDDGKKRMSALSGGEAARLFFGRLALDQPNVLVLDEPTNHLDLESIEALVEALARFEGTLILVSHDRWFVSRIATRVVEITPTEILDYLGTYEEYVHFSGDDHLDADTVILKTRREKRKKGGAKGRNDRRPPADAPDLDAAKKRAKLEKRRDDLVTSLEAVEARVQRIDEIFCRPGYYDETPPERVAKLEGERLELQAELERSTEAWDEVERALEALVR
jgi:ABC-type multidrug transport system ATPase subunit